MIKASCLLASCLLTQVLPLSVFFVPFRLFPELRRRESHNFLEPISSGSETQWSDNLNDCLFARGACHFLGNKPVKDGKRLSTGLIARLLEI